MYRYKINNSYTIYVNYTYLNECIKASKNPKGFSNSTSYVKSQLAKEPKRNVTPLALETKVHHKTFGDGRVVESDNRGHISILFDGEVRKFLYPQAFDMGYLTKVVM